MINFYQYFSIFQLFSYEKPHRITAFISPSSIIAKPFIVQYLELRGGYRYAIWMACLASNLFIDHSGVHLWPAEAHGAMHFNRRIFLPSWDATAWFIRRLSRTTSQGLLVAVYIYSHFTCPLCFRYWDLFAFSLKSHLGFFSSFVDANE